MAVSTSAATDQRGGCVVLVLRHRDQQPVAEGGLSILDSPDPPAGVTFG
jgi:hypothetical protein